MAEIREHNLTIDTYSIMQLSHVIVCVCVFCFFLAAQGLSEQDHN